MYCTFTPPPPSPLPFDPIESLNGPKQQRSMDVCVYGVVLSCAALLPPAVKQASFQQIPPTLCVSERLRSRCCCWDPAGMEEGAAGRYKARVSFYKPESLASEMIRLLNKVCCCQ